MRKNYFLSFLLSFITVALFAQSGEISGKLIDENGQAIPFANIAIVDNGVPTGVGATTDFDGFYSIKPLNPGQYDVKFSVIGYTSVIKAGVVVKNDKTTYIDQQLSPSETKIEEIVVVRYKTPLIDPGETSSQQTMTSEDIENLATRDITNIASTTAGVSKGADGEISIRGSRADGVVYYVDGIRVNGKVNLPVTAVEQIDVITGGVPAKYGEATGGVINVSTKGGAKKLTGGFEVLESLDRWRYDLINVNLAGPIIKNKENQTVLGFAINGEYNHQLDPTPSAVKMYKVNDDKLADLQVNPLFLDEDLIKPRAEQLTMDDLEETRINQNVRAHTGRLNLRLDYRINDNMKLSVGGNGNYDYRHRKIDQYSLLNSENNPLYTTWNYRAFVRFTHNIKKKESEDGTIAKKGFLQNGFYSLQVGYEKYLRNYEDDTHGDNSFAYGYIGQFKTTRTAKYDQGIDDQGNAILELVDYTDEKVVFKPYDVNKYGTAYTTQFYELSGAELNSDGYYEENEGVITNLDYLNGKATLINGKRAEIPYDLWYNTGRQYNGHGVDNNNDQFSASVDGGFDILKAGAESRNKHSISFGFTFEQRVSRKYTVSPLALWDIARNNVNSHLELDKTQRYLLENGDTTLITDGVVYNNTSDTSFYFYGLKPDVKQSVFDKNLRTKIGSGEFDWIDMDNLPLETFSIDMFSADELLNSGNQLISYRGYDVHGNLSNDKTSFADFWNKVDETGEKTRPIAAFKPIYMAGYIEDKFQLKDLTFRIGLRVDRYDANQYVLKDPYSIVGSRMVGDSKALITNASVIPSNIGDDYVMYVNSQPIAIRADQTDPTSEIVGYNYENVSALGFRKGDKWYDIEGQEVRNIGSIGGSPVPLLPEGQTSNPIDEGFKPELAFEKYKAQYTFMPRLQFSFNISDNALFFAHYDQLSQSPQSRISDGFFTNRSIGSPMDYYFFNTIGSNVIANPNLKAETTIDFQLGFKQKLNKSSALTFSAYFKEFKNQIQVRRYAGVFPNPGEYYSYDNIDFGTTKGFEFGYELRRTNNIKFNVNYTLQFADGTGSDDVTQLQVVRASAENFRNVAALDFDSRHSINVVVDYRFGSGDDYNGPTTKKGAQILSDFGVNLLTQVRSGTPYTKQVRASAERATVPDRINAEGTINGSRIGWNFNMDLKINKSFAVNLKSKKEDVEATSLNFDVYLRIDNLLGIANVVDVYRYTGSASDDGYLGSAAGQVVVNNADNPTSYRDLYKAGVNNPNNYSLPRRIFLGASVFF